MSALESIRPKNLHRVIDLVKAAGHDVSDWANFNGSSPATNPKYCYEWCFEQPGRAIIVCLWHEEMVESSDGVTVSFVLKNRADATGPRKKRMEKLLNGIAAASSDTTPLRVIVLAGDRRVATAESSRASSVRARHLDNVPWHVTQCDPESGACELRRGPAVSTIVDQFIIDGPIDGPTQRTVTGKVYNRDAALRQRTLERAQGFCEYCGEPGFTMLNGNVFLETHHIDPLADGGLDVAENLIALCPNHHREAHHGLRAAELRAAMLRIVADYLAAQC